MTSPDSVRTNTPTPAAWLLVLIAIAAVCLLAAYVDRPAGQWFLAHRDMQPWLLFRKTLWPLGSGVIQPALLLLALGAGVAVKKPRVVTICKWLLLALVIATLLTYGIKRAVRRPRPEHMDDPRPALAVQFAESDWHSFPSGDVLVTTALIAVLWGTLGRSACMSWLWLIPALVALQRLAAARHFPSDVLAAFLLALWLSGPLVRAARRRLTSEEPAPIPVDPCSRGDLP